MRFRGGGHFGLARLVFREGGGTGGGRSPRPIELSGTGPAALMAAGPHRFGEAYVQAVAAPERLRDGKHYTPRALSGALWRELYAAGADPARGGVYDPGCGTGSLLLAPLRRALACCRGDSPQGLTRSVLAAAAQLAAQIDESRARAAKAAAQESATTAHRWQDLVDSD